MPPPQDGRTCFFLTPHLRTIGGGAVAAGAVSAHHCHTTHFCILWSRPWHICFASKSTLPRSSQQRGPSVSFSLHPFVRDKFQFQNWIGETSPQQPLHWYPPKYLQQLARKSCSVHVLLGDALACVPVTARLRHAALRSPWHVAGGRGAWARTKKPICKLALLHNVICY